MVEIRWSIDAYEDLEEIYNFIKRDSAIHAESVKFGIINKIEILSKFPRIGSPVKELLPERIRMILYFPYRIYYEFKNEIIEVIRILHGSRELKLYKK